MMNPENGALLTLEIWDAAGGAPLASVTADAVRRPGRDSTRGPAHRSHLLAADRGRRRTSEGQYCLDTRFEPGENCTGGGGDPI